MEKLIESLIVSSPSAVAVIVVVIYFLRYLKCREKQNAEISAACHKSHAEVTKTVTACVDRATKAINENTRTLGAVDATMRHVQAHIRTNPTPQAGGSQE